METLSKAGRQVICDMLGIKDENSIFIHNKDAFVDRVKLLSTETNVLKWIDIYKKELDNFIDEDTYIDYIHRKKDKLYKILSGLYTNNIENVYMLYEKALQIGELQVDRSIKKVLDIDKSDNSFLRIYSDKIVFSAFKFGLPSLKITDNLHDFIYDITKCEIVSSVDDLEIALFEKSLHKYLSLFKHTILCTVLDLVSPKYINFNSFVACGDEGGFFQAAPNFPVSTLDKINTEIKEHKTFDTTDFNVELCELSIKGDSIYKKDVYGNEHFLLGNELDRVNITRQLKKENSSEYDDYFEVSGRECKLMSKYFK